ncbi:hypothetical protein [Halotalea alkalilenta]|uniref:Uncharacterized protein n=1 Tax=Halotalea alkalilenta TaxID=376489 RepID=A0A172YFM1_9GAMM|nr:hypothetical protein [Halotalea alkalilenta]ANF58069.1 hypothetical protein A5892_11810 [Halotalea alkalilenta]
MPDIDDLRTAYKKKNDILRRHWEDMENLALQLEQGFAEYLGVSGQHLQLGDERIPYVEIGRNEGGEFVSHRNGGLQRDQDKLLVMFRIAVDEAPEAYPKELLLIDITIRKVNEAFLVAFEDGKGAHPTSIQKSVEDEELALVYERISEVLLERLNFDDLA